MRDTIEIFKEVLTGGVYDESAWHPLQNESTEAKWPLLRRWKHRALVKLAKRLDSAGISVLRRVNFDRKAREEGLDWPLLGYSMIGRRRLDNLQFCVETALAEGLPGDFIETGVWRGGACMLIKSILDARQVRDRTVWLADSFRGLPKPKDAADGDDLSEVGLLAVSADQVRRNFARFGLLDERVRFLEGWFCDTLPAAPIQQLAVLRLDGDLYHSTMDALTHLYHRVVPGGFVIVDDYGSWPSCRQAVSDFLAARGEQPNIQKIDTTGVYWRTATGRGA